MPDREPRRISRRDALIVLTAVLGAGSIGFLSYDGRQTNIAPLQTNTLPEMPPENLHPFIPSAEIAEEIDSDTFETITEELFSFSNKVDAGWASGLDTTSQTDPLAWKRSIPFQINSNPNLLHLRWGYRSSAQLGTFILDPSAREIAIGRFEYGFGVPFLSLREFFTDPENFPKDFIENLESSRVVNFTKNEPPSFFWPAPTKTAGETPANEVQPVELSAHWLSAFLKQAIESFNARIPIQEEIPKIELGKLV